MAVRIRQSPESLVQCLELGGYKVHSVEKIAGAPGRDIDIRLQNSVVLKWDSCTKTIWAEGPSRTSCRKIESFLHKICEGHWLEKLEAIQRRRLMIYLDKTSRRASAQLAAQSKIVSAKVAAQSKVVSAKLAAQSRIVARHVAVRGRILAANLAVQSRIASENFAVKSRLVAHVVAEQSARRSRELGTLLAKKTAHQRYQLANYLATRAPRFARFFDPGRVDASLPPSSETRLP